jgi:hypothetical protein
MGKVIYNVILLVVLTGCHASSFISVKTLDYDCVSDDYGIFDAKVRHFSPNWYMINAEYDLKHVLLLLKDSMYISSRQDTLRDLNITGDFDHTKDTLILTGKGKLYLSFHLSKYVPGDTVSLYLRGGIYSNAKCIPIEKIEIINDDYFKFKDYFSRKTEVLNYGCFIIKYYKRK